MAANPDNPLGNWTLSQIKKARYSTETSDDHLLLEQPIRSAVLQLLPTPKLLKLAQLAIPTYNSKNEKVKSEETSRFEVMYGNHTVYSKRFPLDVTDYESFNTMIVDFYVKQFNSRERPMILEAITYAGANVQHIIVFSNYYDNTLHPYKLKKEIVAAATFLIGKDSSILLYIACRDSHLPPDEFKRKKPGYSQTLPEEQIYLRHHELGLFLIGMIQKITSTCTNSYRIVCEAQIHDVQKAFFFYKRLLFNQIPKDHPSVEYYRIRHPKLFHDEQSDLLWLESKNAVYLTNTKILYGDHKRLIDAQRAISFAVEQVLNLDNKIQEIRPIVTHKQALFKQIYESNNTNTVISSASKTRNLRSKDHRVANRADLKEILRNIKLNEIQEVQEFDRILIRDLPVGDNSSFQCLSGIAFGVNDRFEEIRGYLSYVCKSLASFNANTKLFNYNDSLKAYKKEENKGHFTKESDLHLFHVDAIDAILQMEKIFDEKDTFYKSYYCVRDSDEIKIDCSPDEMQAIFYSLAVVEHHPLYFPDRFEFRLIATALNLRITVIQAHYCTTKQGRAAWRLQKAEDFMPYEFLQESSSQNEPHQVFVLRDNDKKYYYVESGREQSLQFLNDIERNRIGSASSLVIEMKKDRHHNYQIRTQDFDDRLFRSYRIPRQHPLFLPFILNTPKEWEEDHLTNRYNFKDIHSLGSKKWLSGTVIHDFLQFISKKMTSLDIMLVTPMQAETCVQNSGKRQTVIVSETEGDKSVPMIDLDGAQTATKLQATSVVVDGGKLLQSLRNTLKKSQYFCGVVNTEGTHWVTVEFKIPNDPVKFLELSIMDSMKKPDQVFDLNRKLTNSDWRWVVSKQWLWLISKLVFQEKLLPDIEMKVEEKDEWDDFFDKRLSAKTLSQTYPVQSDGWNCGIFALNRACRVAYCDDGFRFLNSDLLMPLEEFRIYILQKLLTADNATFNRQILKKVQSKLNKLVNAIDDTIENDDYDYMEDFDDDESLPDVDDNVLDEEMKGKRIPVSKIQTGKSPASFRKFYKYLDVPDDTISDEDKENPQEIEKEVSDNQDSDEESSVGKSDVKMKQKPKPRRLRLQLHLKQQREAKMEDVTNQDDMSVDSSDSGPQGNKSIDKDDSEEDQDDEEFKPKRKTPRKVPKKRTKSPQRKKKKRRITETDAEETRTDDEVLEEKKNDAFAALEDFDKNYTSNLPKEHQKYGIVPDLTKLNWVKQKKKGLTPNQKRNWEEYYFDGSQRNIQLAKRSIDQYFKKNLQDEKKKFRNLDEELRRIIAQMDEENLTKNAYAEAEKQYKTVRKNWIASKTAILAMEYDQKEMPIIHARDTIKAISVEEAPTAKYRGGSRYWALCEQEDGSLIKKEVPFAWLENNVEKEYISLLQEHNKEKGWLAFDGSKPKFVKNRKELDKSISKFKNIYEYTDPDTGGYIITWIRLCVEFRRKADGELDISKILYYLTHDRANHVYIQISRDELVSILRPGELKVYDVNAIVQMKENINLYEQNQKNMFATVSYDRHDREYNSDHVGNITKPQFYYVFVRDRNYQIPMVTKQIAKLKYNPISKKWLGYEKEGDDFCIVELHESWIVDNFSEDQIKYFREIAEDEYKHFCNLPVEDIIEVHPTMDISSNPIIRYKNDDNGICAFAAFASALHYLGYYDQALEIMTLSQKANEDCKIKFNSLQSIIQLIDSKKTFKTFRKKYQNKKIKNCLELKDEDHHELDIWLVVLEQTDNHCSHAVAMTGEYIFDCNTSNALPRTIEGISCCCGTTADYRKIARGYKWLTKRFNPNEWKKGKNHNKK